MEKRTEEARDQAGFARLLRWAFGRSLPPEELERWLAASPAQREKAAARLHAIRNWPQARERGADTLKSELAELAGVTPQRMRNMVAQWRTAEAKGEKSLALLGLRTDPRHSPPLANKELRTNAERIVRDLVGKHGIRSVEAVVTRAMEDERLRSAPVGVNLLRGMVKRIRMERDGTERFGSHILIDEFPLAVSSPSGRAYRAVMVLDVATRLAFGAAVEAGTPTMATVRAAAQDAADRLEQQTFPGVELAGKDIRVTLAVTDPDAVRMLRFFAEQPGWTEHLGKRGRLALQVLGPRIGRVDLRPRLDEGRNMREALDDTPSISNREAEALLGFAIDRHNREILTGGVETADVATCRQAIARVLRSAARVS